MLAWKPAIAASLIIAGLACSTQAQAQAPKSNAGGATGAYPAAQLTEGASSYYGMTPNFANYGLSGTYPYYGGYGYAGYGPGPQFGAHYASSPYVDRTKGANKLVDPKAVAPKRPVKPDPFGNGSTRSVPNNLKRR